MSTPKTTEGYAPFHFPSAGKQCKTWYKVVGDLKSRRPLVILHGGPGLTHDYLINLADLASSHSIPVVLYDQIGNGRSTQLPEKAVEGGAFWNERLFLAELDNLLVHLDIHNDYDIYGHSWGGMLGACHAIQQPKGLKHLVLASSPSSMPVWDEVQQEIRATLPQSAQDALTRHEAAGTIHSREYADAMRVYQSRHSCKITPAPRELLLTFMQMEDNPSVYLTMCGPDEFNTLGTLKNWSIIDEIHKITATALLLNGRDDTAKDRVLAPYFRFIPKVKWVQFAESSHMIHIEERQRLIKVVGDFLTEV